MHYCRSATALLPAVGLCYTAANYQWPCWFILGSEQHEVQAPADELLQHDADMEMAPPIKARNMKPSTWPPCGTCQSSLCVRTTTMAWAQQSGGGPSHQPSTQEGTTRLV